MPRDGGGIYTLPGGNPVVPGTIIDTTWANPTMDDIAAAMSDSLSRSGKGGMTFSLRGPDGSAAVPTFSFTNEPSSGRYRDGPGTIVESVLGQNVVRYTASGLEQWNGLAWEPLTPRDAIDTPFDPGPTALTSTNVQDAIEEVFAATGGTVTAENVTYDDTLVYFGAPTVQIAIDQLGVDLAAVAGDVATNAGDIQVIEGEIDIIDSTILGMIGDINLNETNIALNAAAIVNLGNDDDIQNDRLDDAEAEIIINAAGISQNTGIINQHTSLINTNATNISNNVNAINTNAFNIGGLDTRVTINEGNISDNQDDLNDILGVFPGGVLIVSAGGTGVTTSTGTGSTVRSNSPALTGSPTAPYVALGTQNSQLANVEHVYDFIDLVGKFESNSNGYRTRLNLAGVYMQWGFRDVAPETTVSQNLPFAFANTASVAQGASLHVSYVEDDTGKRATPQIKMSNSSTITLTNASTLTRKMSWMVVGY